MRAVTLAEIATVALLFAAACGASPAPVPATGPAGKMEHGMANCPSAVTGASTDMRLVDGGVVLDITAADPTAAQEIVARAHMTATKTPADPARGAHTGAHGGPGDLGHCPVVHADTIVNVDDIAGGARITVLAVDPAGAPALQAETRERIEWLDPTKHAR